MNIMEIFNYGTRHSQNLFKKFTLNSTEQFYLEPQIYLGMEFPIQLCVHKEWVENQSLFIMFLIKESKRLFD